MANVNVTFKMDKNLKKEATTLFENLGMSFNQAIILFVKQALREQRIPFEITINTPNKETLAAFKEIELMKEGKVSNKAYDNVDEMFEEVLK